MGFLRENFEIDSVSFGVLEEFFEFDLDFPFVIAPEEFTEILPLQEEQ